jgi:hypothetical protein
MSWKLIVLGGLASYVAMFVVGMGTGVVIHNGILQADYRAHSAFWVPELNQDPPDMAALMPYWVTTGLITSFVVAALYGWVRSAFRGPGWRRGLLFGLFLVLFSWATYLGWSGVFNLPAKIWIWWGVDLLLLYLVGGAVLGLVAEKVAPADGG